LAGAAGFGAAVGAWVWAVMVWGPCGAGAGVLAGAGAGAGAAYRAHPASTRMMTSNKATDIGINLLMFSPVLSFYLMLMGN